MILKLALNARFCKVSVLSYFLLVISLSVYSNGFVDILESDASKGDVISQLLLAEVYEKGDGVPVNYAAAYKWYTMAAKQGEMAARERIVHIIDYGLFTPDKKVGSIESLHADSAVRKDLLQFEQSLYGQFQLHQSHYKKCSTETLASYVEDYLIPEEKKYSGKIVELIFEENKLNQQYKIVNKYLSLKKIYLDQAAIQLIEHKKAEYKRQLQEGQDVSTTSELQFAMDYLDSAFLVLSHDEVYQQQLSAFETLDKDMADKVDRISVTFMNLLRLRVIYLAIERAEDLCGVWFDGSRSKNFQRDYRFELTKHRIYLKTNAILASQETGTMKLLENAVKKQIVSDEIIRNGTYPLFKRPDLFLSYHDFEGVMLDAMRDAGIYEYQKKFQEEWRDLQQSFVDASKRLVFLRGKSQSYDWSLAKGKEEQLELYKNQPLGQELVVQVGVTCEPRWGLENTVVVNAIVDYENDKDRQEEQDSSKVRWSGQSVKMGNSVPMNLCRSVSGQETCLKGTAMSWFTDETSKKTYFRNSFELSLIDFKKLQKRKYKYSRQGHQSYIYSLTTFDLNDYFSRNSAVFDLNEYVQSDTVFITAEVMHSGKQEKWQSPDLAETIKDINDACRSF